MRDMDSILLHGHDAEVYILFPGKFFLRLFLLGDDLSLFSLPARLRGTGAFSVRDSAERSSQS